MASGDNLSPPGTSTYSSNIFHAGDGTWDSSRDLFLLPNVMGLPFDVMQYNGMGNRFAALSEYHTIILGHGILAAITFLFIVPIAITVACFYHANPRLALRIHIALQTLTVILVTIIFILGYFAVGPVRSLTNPHHGIGLAIYVLILVQAIGGWIIKKIEKGKVRYHIPLKLMLHQWMGRTIALLALAQSPIGLTLYGSPAYLFVLYSLVVAGWILLYFILTYQSHKRSAMVPYDNMDGSYVTSATGVTGSGSNVSHHPDRHKLEALAATVGLGAAIAAFRRRRNSQKAHHRTDSAMDMIPRPGGSEYTEKLTEGSWSSNGGRPPRRSNSTWKDRVLAGAAAVGAAGVAAKFLGRRKDHDDDDGRYTSRSDLSYNRPPLGGSVMTGSASNLTRMEEGHQPQTGYQPPSDHWDEVEQREAAQAAGRPDMRSEGSFYTDYSHDDRRNDQQDNRRRSNSAGAKIAGALGGLAAATGVRGFLERRRSKKEERRSAEQRRLEEEDDSTYGSPAPYTDNSPRKGRYQSPTTEVTQTNTDYNRNPGGPPPMASGAINHPPRGPGSNILAPQHPPPQNIPPPPQTPNMAPPPPVHHDSYSTLPSQEFGSPTQQRRPRRYSEVSRNNGNDRVNEPLGGPGAGAGGSGSFGGGSGVLSPPPHIHPDANSGSPDSRGKVASPSISVNVKMSPDGRHVTLRRLNEEEAAAKRAQQERNWRRGRRVREDSRSRSNISPGHGSASPGPSGTAGDERLAMPAGPQGQSPVHSYLSAAAPNQAGLSPPPPNRAGGSVSPGEISPAGEGSGMGSYEENRRRRRAERARAEQARARGQKGGNRVEFSDFS